MEEIVKEKLVYTLNPDQQDAFDWLVPFCLGEKEYRRVLLEGYAGTGKTFLINRVVEAVREVKPFLMFGLTAPTHKAVRVMKRHSEKKDELMFGTIHSFLALKQSIIQSGPKQGKIEYKPDFNPEFSRKIDQIAILMVDETSMLDDELNNYIEDEMRSNTGLLLIYIGDPIQIPPVGKKEKNQGDKVAVPFVKARRELHKINQLVLSKPQRQALGSPIIMYAHAIRDNHKSKIIPFEFKEEYKDALEQLPKSREVLITKFTQYFDCPEFMADADYAKVICYRNATVDYFNKMIREIVYKTTTLPKILPEERLIMMEPLTKGKKILIANSEELIVQKVQVYDRQLQYHLKREVSTFEDVLDTSEEKDYQMFSHKVYEAEVIDVDKNKHTIAILHENYMDEFNAIRAKIEAAAKGTSDQFVRKQMWKSFYDFASKFAWVNYNYAVTAHKSQGSTYDYSFSMEWDMMVQENIEERNSIIYVAATRSRTKLYVLR